MKFTITVLFSLWTQLLLAQSTFVAPGNDSGNGGDPCENKITKILPVIQTWIANKGHEKLDFQGRLGADEYAQKMKQAFKDLSRIECTTDKILIHGIEKTCGNTLPNEENDLIRCNFRRFNSESESGQYRLIHHEVAGIANIEVNAGSASDYFLSNQLSAYLRNQIVKILALEPIPFTAGAEEPPRDTDLVKDIPQGTTVRFENGLYIPPKTPKVKLCEDEKVICVFSFKDPNGETHKSRKIPPKTSYQVEYSAMGEYDRGTWVKTPRIKLHSKKYPEWLGIVCGALSGPGISKKTRNYLNENMTIGHMKNCILEGASVTMTYPVPEIF